MMFGRGKKSNNAPKSDKQDLFGMPDLSAFAVPEDEVNVSNAALEAELAALLDEEEDDVGGGRPQKQHRPHPATQPAKGDPIKHIEAMAAQAMMDIDDDDDDEGDDDELLAELEGITEEDKHTSPALLAPAAPPTKPRTPSPSPSPQPKVDQSSRPSPGPKTSPVKGLSAGTSEVRRSPSPARRPGSSPATTGPSPATAGPSPATTGPSPAPAVTSPPVKSDAAPADFGSLLQHRGQCYQQAIARAEHAGEGSKIRRYKRQLKTIQDMQRKMKLGKPVDKTEIPPELFIPADSQPPPQQSGPAPVSQPAPPPPAQQPTPVQQPTQATHDGDKMAVLTMRRDQYKMAAVLAKRSGDMKTAADQLKVAKQFDTVIQAVEAGQEVDLSEMPPPPQQATPKPTPAPRPSQPPPAHAPPPHATPPQATPPQPSPQAGAASSEPQGGYASPRTVMEALVQRRDKYRSMADKAKEEKNDSKARRIGRIVKQYEDAMRKQKLNKPVELSELASLPEFPPFPAQSAPHPAPSNPPPPQVPARVGVADGGQVARGAQQGGAQPARPAPLVRQMSAKENMYQKNVATLKNKINQFKRLALEAKKKGDIYEAKRLLRIAKEIEPMLVAAEGGLPINMDTIPKLPHQEESQAVSPPTSPEPAQGMEAVAGPEAKEVYLRLIATLKKQIEICSSNAEVYGKLGNIKSVKRFEEFEEHCQQDLDVLISKQSRGEPIPRHHYEQRTLPSVRVNPDIKENEAEIVVVQGLQLHCPSDKDAKDIDTYVKVEFPYPSDDPQSHKTGWAKGVDSPQYNNTFTVDINRSSRAFNSAVKRKALKLEVIYSKGLLRGHKTLGTASLKLVDLDSKCELHDSVPLLDGRREIGGKIEVKVRIHHPLSGLKEDFVKEKWLIIDSVHKAASSTKKASPKPSAQASSSGSQRSHAADSIEIIKWEMNTLKKKIMDLQAHKQPVPKEFAMSYATLQDKLKKLQTYLKEGGTKARQAYVSRLKAVSPNLIAQAKEELQAGHKERAAMCMTKKKLVDAEISALTRR